MAQSIQGGEVVSLVSELRRAARDARHVTFAYGGGDPSELLALAKRIGEVERCAIDYTVTPTTPGTITVHFVRQAGTSP